MLQKIKNIYHLIRALTANYWYGFPSRKMHLIGVTGTDGKTTTTHLIYHVLSSAGKKVSMISTIFAKIGETEYETGFHVTTPDATLIPRYLKLALDKGQHYFILETTSHRIDQNQLAGLQFDVAVITNITHEHLDYHKTMSEYARTKMKLVQMAKVGIVNIDDDMLQKQQKLTSHFKFPHDGTQSKQISNLKTYGLQEKADYTFDFRKDIPDLTDFNAYNYLAAYAVCRELGLEDKEIRTAFSTFILPSGRIDIVYDKKFKVIVDFAHTPNAIVHILKSVKKQYVHGKGRLIHVFSSAGLRDHTKRFGMGKASAENADVSYITEEDSRTEDPEKIAHEIGAGFGNKKYFVELDREKAIHTAIANATFEDVVIITGKGHEKSLCRGKIEFPWSDTDCVKAYVSTLS